MTNELCWGNHEPRIIITGIPVKPVFTYGIGSDLEYRGTEADIGDRAFCGMNCLVEWWQSDGGYDYPHLIARINGKIIPRPFRGF